MFGYFGRDKHLNEQNKREALQAHSKLLNQQQFNAFEELKRLKSKKNECELYINPFGNVKSAHLDVDAFLEETFPTLVEEKRRIQKSGEASKALV